MRRAKCRLYIISSFTHSFLQAFNTSRLVKMIQHDAPPVSIDIYNKRLRQIHNPFSGWWGWNKTKRFQSCQHLSPTPLPKNSHRTYDSLKNTASQINNPFPLPQTGLTHPDDTMNGKSQEFEDFGRVAFLFPSISRKDQSNSAHRVVRQRTHIPQAYPLPTHE